MTSKKPKTKQQRSKHQPSGASRRLRPSSVGQMTAGLIVLGVLGTGAVVYFDPGVENAPPLASIPIEEALRQPIPAPAQQTPDPLTPEAQTVPDVPAPEAVAPAPSTPTAVPEPLSQDPVARLPETAAWLKNAVASAAYDGRPMIAIVIDDVGLDRPRSRRAMALPAPVTIALMAYAEDAQAQASMARKAGHELIVHLPMEPHNENEDPGPNALLSDLTQAEFNRRLEWNLSQFSGYVGVNNHMGSKITSDPVALAPVMKALKQRGLMFLDSRTTGETKGLATARRFGVPAVERNVFLDHEPTPIAVRTALIEAEDVAEQSGFAIAIGHPKEVTLEALEEWLPEVKKRGFAVVPLTAVMRHVSDEG